MANQKPSPPAARKASRPTATPAPAPTATNIDALTPDPQNARRHDADNLRMIAQSLREVGPARSIVVDENLVVRAGNGTIAAAKRVGITKVRIVQAARDELIAVQRTDLTEVEKTRLALFDNRSAELATWDADVIQALQDAGVPLDDLWTDEQLAALFKTEGATGDGDGDTSSQMGGLEYRVVVDCKSEAHQTELLRRFEEEGLTCRALIS